MVFAAKLKGEQDTFIAYRDYLSRPKAWRDLADKPVLSTVLQVENVVILGHPWMALTHDDSELIGYRTRYFATVRDDLAILFTYSVVKDGYDALVGEFDSVLKSLKTKPRPGFGAEETAPAEIVPATEDRTAALPPGPTVPVTDGGSADQRQWLWGIAALVLAGVATIAVRSRPHR